MSTRRGEVPRIPKSRRCARQPLTTQGDRANRDRFQQLCLRIFQLQTCRFRRRTCLPCHSNLNAVLHPYIESDSAPMLPSWSARRTSSASVGARAPSLRPSFAGSARGSTFFAKRSDSPNRKQAHERGWTSASGNGWKPARQTRPYLCSTTSRGCLAWRFTK